MDRSFLSDAAVVAASRDFVCIRLATYEDEAEGKLLASLFRGRSGELENTVFAILSPDGKLKMTRAGRSPHMVWRGPPEESARMMAASMGGIAKQYPGKRGASRNAASLPIAKDVRRGLNIASCDNLPFVVATATKKAELAKLEKTLAAVAWRDEFLGRFVYALSSDRKDLGKIEGVKKADGYLVIQPGSYGQTGKVLLQLPRDAGCETIVAALKRAKTQFRAERKDHHRHVRQGKEDGVHWETEIPVTDPGIPPGGRHRGPPPGGPRDR